MPLEGRDLIEYPSGFIYVCLSRNSIQTVCYYEATFNSILKYSIVATLSQISYCLLLVRCHYFNFIFFHIYSWSFIQCEQEQFIMLSILMKLPGDCPCFRCLVCKHRLWPNTVEFCMFLDNIKTDDPMWFLWLTVLKSVSHFELRASQSHNTVDGQKHTLSRAVHYYGDIVNSFLQDLFLLFPHREVAAGDLL